MADSPSRRAVVQGLAGMGAMALSPRGLAKGKKDRPPNFVVIMSDEHDGGVMGCMGDPVVRTPHLDRLAEQGVLFRSCYTPSPVCGPACLAFTFGQYASRRRPVQSFHSQIGPTVFGAPTASGWISHLVRQAIYAWSTVRFQRAGQELQPLRKNGRVLRRSG